MSVPRALPPGATAWLGVGVATGPLDPAGATARRGLCCPYCAAMLDWRGERAGALILRSTRYACPNCRAVWTIELVSVEGGTG